MLKKPAGDERDGIAYILPPSQRTALFTVYVITIIYTITDLSRQLLAIAVFAEAIVPLIFVSLCFSCELPVKRAERKISQPARDLLLALLELAHS